jgi:hypothetical protein
MKISIKANDGRLIEKVVSKPRALIGRSLKCDIAIPEDSLSREHCLIELEGTELYVTDLESANGVYVEGKKIKPAVRTRFVQYLPIQLGFLECRVSTEVTGVNKLKLQTIPDRVKPEMGYTSSAANPNQHIYRRGPRPEADNKPAGNSLGLILSVLVFIGGVAYLTREVSTKRRGSLPVARDQNTTQSPTDRKLVTAPKEFLNNNAYHEIAAHIDCQLALDKCKQIGLNEKQGEGILTNKHEVFVVILPSRHVADYEISKLRNHPEKDELIALYLIFQSQLFKDLTQSFIGQIHLVIRSEQRIASKVLRLHQQQFVPEDATLLLTDVTAAIKSGNALEFWAKYRRRIPVIKL